MRARQQGRLFLSFLFCNARIECDNGFSVGFYGSHVVGFYDNHVDGLYDNILMVSMTIILMVSNDNYVDSFCDKCLIAKDDNFSFSLFFYLFFFAKDVL